MQAKLLSGEKISVNLSFPRAAVLVLEGILPGPGSITESGTASDTERIHGTTVNRLLLIERLLIDHKGLGIAVRTVCDVADLEEIPEHISIRVVTR